MNAIAIRPQEQPSQHFGMGDLERIAIAIADGGLFGSKDRNAVLTLCLLAQAEGKHPAIVMQDYHIIQGKPAKKAEAILRDFISAGGRVEWHALSDVIADATFSHPAGGTVRIDWTMDRARAAGIANPMWKKYPRQMLRSRVISEGARSVCPSATSGLYEVGEVQDIVAEDTAKATNGGVINGTSQEVGQSAHDSPAEPHTGEPAPRKRENWGGRYPNKTSLHKALIEVEANLADFRDTDAFEAYLTTPEYQDFIAICEQHAPHYLEGGEPAPPEFKGIFAIEQATRDRLNLPDYIQAGADIIQAG